MEQKKTYKYSDKDLVEKIKQSNHSSFKLLYDRYSENLYGFLWRKIRNADLAKDLVQELFIRVWNNRRKLDEGKSIKSYLFTIANNLAIDHLRYQVKHQNEDIDNTQTTSTAVYVLDESFDIDERIKKAINSLPEAQRNVFCLSRFEELKYREISEMLNISIKTVENHISNALKTLRKEIQFLIFLIFYIKEFLQSSY